MNAGAGRAWPVDPQRAILPLRREEIPVDERDTAHSRREQPDRGVAGCPPIVCGTSSPASARAGPSPTHRCCDDSSSTWSQQAVEGRSDQLKEYSIGVEVFGRGPAFDPRVDTIVRVQARRLRSKLQEDHRGEGRADPGRHRSPQRPLRSGVPTRRAPTAAALARCRRGRVATASCCRGLAACTGEAAPRSGAGAGSSDRVALTAPRSAW